MEEDFRELLRMGREAYQKREYARAEELLGRVVEKYDNYADVHNMLGVIFHDRGLFSKAQAHFERALAINPNYTEAAMNLAVTYNDLGCYQQAREIFGRVLNISREAGGQLEPFLRGKIANMYADIGDVYHTAGLYREACREYEKALELGPSFVDIRLRLAQALRDAGERQAAITQLKRILQDRPNFLPAHLNLGVMYYSMGQAEDARRHWQEALRLDPDNKSCHMYLSMLEKEKA